jgi:hypothetical protein
VQGLRQIELRTYRDCRLEVLDDGGDGWMVVVHAPDAPSERQLRNRVPQGLAPLLAEAKAHVDRRLGLVGVLPDYP